MSVRLGWDMSRRSDRVIVRFDNFPRVEFVLSISDKWARAWVVQIKYTGPYIHTGIYVRTLLNLLVLTDTILDTVGPDHFRFWSVQEQEQGWLAGSDTRNFSLSAFKPPICNGLSCYHANCLYACRVLIHWACTYRVRHY